MIWLLYLWLFIRDLFLTKYTRYNLANMLQWIAFVVAMYAIMHVNAMESFEAFENETNQKLGITGSGLVGIGVPFTVGAITQEILR
jgi:hypothetical protein